MDHEKNRSDLCGCYVTLPTMFHDGDLELNLPAMKRHIANHWPEYGVKLWNLLEEKDYEQAERQMVKVPMPYYQI
jgi:hypothetical protein